jgi:hypothetical protein
MEQQNEQITFFNFDSAWWHTNSQGFAYFNPVLGWSASVGCLSFANIPIQSYQKTLGGCMVHDATAYAPYARCG